VWLGPDCAVGSFSFRTLPLLRDVGEGRDEAVTEDGDVMTGLSDDDVDCVVAGGVHDPC